MIKRIIAFILPAFSLSAMAQNVGIGTKNPHSSAILDVSSTTRGVLIPRLAAISEVGITNPAKGLLIYQTNQQRFRYNAGTPAAPAFTNIYTFDDLQNGYGQWWSITGTNTAPALRFYGTTNNAEFRLRVNNQRVATFGTTFTNNVLLGLDAGRSYLGDNNIIIGRRASWANDGGAPITASHQIAIGDSALHYFSNSNSNTIGNGFNIAIGKNSQLRNERGGSNISIGHYALEIVESDQFEYEPFSNIAIGQGAMNYSWDARDNVAIGVGAFDRGEGLVNCTIVGNAATKLTGSSGATMLGAVSKVERANDNVTALGHEAKALGLQATHLENIMVLGSIEVTKWAFGRSTPEPNRAIQVGTNNTNGNGAYLTRTGTWTNVSDRNKKEDFTAINANQLLQQLAALPITRWQYKAGGGWHIGPMAQDFKAIFNLGSTDDKTINTVDPVGIALAAAQALLAETELLKKRTAALEAQLHK